MRCARGPDPLALKAMQDARAATPTLAYAYGLAVVQALAGEDPRPRRAARPAVNPLEPQARASWCAG